MAGCLKTTLPCQYLKTFFLPMLQNQSVIIDVKFWKAHPLSRLLFPAQMIEKCSQNYHHKNHIPVFVMKFQLFLWMADIIRLTFM